MNKQFILLDVKTGKYFTGADWVGVYFSREDKAHLFDDEAEAVHRLINEMECWPSSFDDMLIAIIPVYYP